MKEGSKIAQLIKYYFLTVENILGGLKLLFSSPKIAFTYLSTIVLFLNQSNRMAEFTVSFTMMTFTVGMLAIMTATNANEKFLRDELIDIAQRMISSGIFLIFALFFKLATDVKEFTIIKESYPEFSAVLAAFASLLFFIGYLGTAAGSSALFTFGILDLYSLMIENDLKNHL